MENFVDTLDEIFKRHHILSHQALIEDYRKQHPHQPLPVIHCLIIYTGEAAYTYSTDFFGLFGAGNAFLPCVNPKC